MLLGGPLFNRKKGLPRYQVGLRQRTSRFLVAVLPEARAGIPCFLCGSAASLGKAGPVAFHLGSFGMCNNAMPKFALTALDLVDSESFIDRHRSCEPIGHHSGASSTK